MQYIQFKLKYSDLHMFYIYYIYLYRKKLKLYKPYYHITIWNIWD